MLLIAVDKVLLCLPHSLQSFIVLYQNLHSPPVPSSLHDTQILHRLPSSPYIRHRILMLEGIRKCLPVHTNQRFLDPGPQQMHVPICILVLQRRLEHHHRFSHHGPSDARHQEFKSASQTKVSFDGRLCHGRLRLHCVYPTTAVTGRHFEI